MLGIVLALFSLVFVLIVIDTWSALGAQPGGARLERIQRSPQYADGKFVNPLPPRNGNWVAAAREWFFGNKEFREPSQPLPVVQRSATDFTVAPADLRVTWLGHSTLLIEIDGRRILTDPMWGDYASPGRLFGVKRFFAPPLSLDELPPLDAVILSHDHYDHLNEQTIRALRERVPLFVVPLGVGAHLEYWGVPPERIRELDWWERTDVGGVEVVCTPARHFSGRSLTDSGRTLWSSWAVLGRERRVFFSGDTGMFPGFREIGERLGPFDATLLEVGAYDADWADVHMGPEQAVEAHRMLRGDLMLPIHWGTFDLAFHGWTEPAERLLVAAEGAGVRVAVPRPGESVSVAAPAAVDRWWPQLPWESAEEAPVVSSGIPASIALPALR